MKLNLIKTTTLEFDTEKEKARINSVFKAKKYSAIRERQLEIIKALEENNLSKMITLYHALPESKFDGCSEKEYVGLWFDDWTNARGEYFYSVEEIEA